MASKLHKNAILTGCIDSLCLVCETHLRCEEDANRHIGKPIHMKNLEENLYMDKYKEHRIRKVKRGYFCEFCNRLLFTAAKVGMHVAQQSHIDKRGVQLIKRLGNNIIVGNIFINEKAWHGLIDETCVLCNKEFFDELMHKTEKIHIINLVQQKIEFGEGDAVFRLTDDSSAQCLTCNSVLALKTLSNHFEDKDHKTRFVECCESKIASLSSNQQEKSVNEKESQPEKTVIQSEPLDIDEKKGNTKSKKKNNKINEKELQVKNSMSIEKDKSNSSNKIKPEVESKNKDNTQDKLAEIKKAPEINNESNKLNTTKPDLLKTSSKYNADVVEMRYKVLEKSSEYRKSGIDIVLNRTTAYCRKCNTDIKMEIEAIENHIGNHSKVIQIENETKTLVNKDNNDKNKILPNIPIKPEENKKQIGNVGIDNNQNFQINVTNTSNEKHSNKIIELDSASNTDENLLSLVKYVPVHKEEIIQDNDAASIVPTDKQTKPHMSIEDAILFAKQNKLTYNKNNQNAFCRICSVKVPSSLRCMKEHVSGANHKANLSKIVQVNSYIPKKPMKNFVKVQTGVENYDIDDIIINEMFCLTKLSFFMITEQLRRLRCQVCEVNLIDVNYVADHIDTAKHEVAMDETPVVCNLDNEFVREVRPGLFHCGYCNLIAGSYNDIKHHLTCEDHQIKKTSAISRLKRHMPDILEWRQERKKEIMRMVMLGKFFGFRSY